NQHAALCQASGEAFYNTSPFRLRDLTSRSRRQQLKADFEAYLDGDPPPLNGSTLKYGFDHEGGPQWQTSDTSPTRSSRSFGRLRFCAAKAWRWRMPFARSAFPN